MTFGDALLAWFREHGRRGLPWRTDRDPYRIVVAEFMLQQTQVERVVPLFERFVARWPSFAALAAASQADVVRAWQGLGYNGRAVRLHRLAGAVVARHAGALPRDEAPLRTLPGVGPYTARAIAAFAFDTDVLAVDTNVRRIVHRTQFGLEFPQRASARELDAAGAALLPPGSGYAFNSALMDLGASLCSARAPKCLLCPLQTHCAAAPIDARALSQIAARSMNGRMTAPPVPFETTARFARGRIVDRLRALPARQRISLLALHAELAPVLPHHDRAAVDRVVSALERDGLIEREDESVRLRE